MTAVPSHNITSKDNTFLKDLRRLTKDSTAYRKQGCFWVEGDHLCRAALVRGQKPAVGVFKTSFWPLAGTEWTQAAMKNIVCPKSLPAATTVQMLHIPSALACRCASTGSGRGGWGR